MVRRQVVVAVLAAGAVTGLPPGARANAPEYACDFDSVQQSAVTGDHFESLVRGYVAHTGGGPVSIRCYVTVAGVEAGSTDRAVGEAGAAVTFGRLSFSASDAEPIALCGEVSTSHGSFHRCFGPTGEPFPPRAVTGLLSDALATTEAMVCLWTRFAGRNGANRLDEVVVEEGGDVYVAGVLAWDCHPYAATP